MPKESFFIHVEADEEPGPGDEDEASVLLPLNKHLFFFLNDSVFVFVLLVTTRNIFFKELKLHRLVVRGEFYLRVVNKKN